MNQVLLHGPGGEEGQIGELSYSPALSVAAVSQQKGQSMKPGHGKLFPGQPKSDMLLISSSQPHGHTQLPAREAGNSSPVVCTGRRNKLQ